MAQLRDNIELRTQTRGDLIWNRFNMDVFLRRKIPIGLTILCFAPTSKLAPMPWPIQRFELPVSPNQMSPQMAGSYGGKFVYLVPDATIVSFLRHPQKIIKY